MIRLACHMISHSKVRHSVCLRLLHRNATVDVQNGPISSSSLSFFEGAIYCDFSLVRPSPLHTHWRASAALFISSITTRNPNNNKPAFFGYAKQGVSLGFVRDLKIAGFLMLTHNKVLTCRPRAILHSLPGGVLLHGRSVLLHVSMTNPTSWTAAC